MTRSTLAALVLLAVGGCGSTALTHGSGARYDQIPQDAYAVVADVHARPGREDDLRVATLGLVAHVRAEPNNVLYFLHEDREHAGHFVFYEIFAEEADFEAHNATAHVRAWFARLPELAEGDVHVVRMRILGNQPYLP